jgi:hypothetical protein
MENSLMEEKYQELMQHPSICGQLPLMFVNGTKVTQFKCKCSACKTTLPDELVRGYVTKPFETVAIVDAVGVCPKCNMATPYLYRLYNDKRVAVLTDKGWETINQKRTILEKIATLLKMSGSKI